MFGLLSGAVGVATGLKGLFGKKKKDPTPTDNILSQAKGAREAADKYGFNPLTMLQYGQPGGAMGGGGSAPPLASIQAITDGLRGIDDITSGDAERRRKAEELQNDLLRVQLDQARSGVVAVGPGADSVGNGPSPLGRRAAVLPMPTGKAFAPRKGGFGSPTKGQNSVAPGRGQEIDPVVNSPGVFEMENVLTGGKPVTIPGEGEPWGIDELATAVIVGAPQALGNYANRRIFGGKPINQWLKDKAEDNEKREKERPKKGPVTKSYEGPGGPVYLPR